jgi:hypothetical protein
VSVLVDTTVVMIVVGTETVVVVNVGVTLAVGMVVVTLYELVADVDVVLVADGAA